MREIPAELSGSVARRTPAAQAGAVHGARCVVSGEARFGARRNDWAVCEVGGVPVVGVFPPDARDGDFLEVAGTWNDDQRWGMQVRLQTVSRILPKKQADAAKYLRRTYRGIGAKKATAIAAHFGDGLFEALDADPRSVAAVPGLSESEAAEFASAWRANKMDRDADALFAAIGITPRMLSNLVESLAPGAADAKQIVARIVAGNPYVLAEKVRGIGFIRADEIASSCGIAWDDPRRIEGAVFHALREAAASDGHCFLRDDELSAKVGDLLAESRGRVPAQLVRDVVAGMVGEGRIGRDGDGLWIPGLLRNERLVASGILEIAGASFDPVPLSGEPGGFLKPAQESAASGILSSPMFVMTGLPGTGKTTTLRAVSDAFEAAGMSVEFAAPTGKAAKRMEQQIGKRARTIHRLLEFHPAFGFGRDKDNPIDADVVVVDEASMIDVAIARRLVDAIDRGRTRLILVGDPNQLPSVGPGRFLRDVVESGVCGAAHLTQILRQEEASDIIVNAHLIHRGEMPRDVGGDLRIVETTSDEETAAVVAKIAADGFGGEFDPRRDVQVLCPMRKSIVGTVSVGGILSRMLNQHGAEIPGQSFRVGDRVIHIRNDYDAFSFPAEMLRDREFSALLARTTGRSSTDEERSSARSAMADVSRLSYGVFNGETGVVRSHDPEDGSVTVVFDDGSASRYSDKNAREKLMMAWAITVHRSQGSEYPMVVVPMSRSNFIMLARNLLYTAVTRASKRIVLVGDPSAIRTAVRNASVARRNSMLRERLTSGQGAASGDEYGGDWRDDFPS